MTNKQELRKKYLILRKQLTNEEIEDCSLQIANKVIELDIWDHSNFHIFLPILKQKEINTEYLLNVLQGRDKNIIISRSDFEDFSMSHYLLTDQTTIKNNSYGIPEPDENGIQIDEKILDVVFVPLIIADYSGNRIGYGKGFYDRFLKKCRPNAIKIGLSLMKPMENTINVLDNDVKLDYIVTPQKIFKI